MPVIDKRELGNAMGADSKNLALPPDRLGTGRFVAENRS
jgi:hypothetical protein